MKLNEIVLLLLVVALATSEECFGADCAHRSIVPSTEAIVDINFQLDKEIRRQYWYYLREADLLQIANIELSGRLVAYLYHRNIVGTFMTVASYYYDEKKSQINTLVRLGNGKYSPRPAAIEPFVPEISSIIIPKEEPQTLQDGSDPTTTGGITVIEEDEEDECLQLSDQKLRKDFDHYLRNAKLAMSNNLRENGRDYKILTYLNYIGSFMIITSCDGEEVQVNTFVRLAKTAISS